MQIGAISSSSSSLSDVAHPASTSKLDSLPSALKSIMDRPSVSDFYQPHPVPTSGGGSGGTVGLDPGSITRNLKAFGDMLHSMTPNGGDGGQPKGSGDAGLGGVVGTPGKL